MALLRQQLQMQVTTTEYDSTTTDGSDATADAADVFKHF